MPICQAIAHQLSAHGLLLRGGFNFGAADSPPTLTNGEASKGLALIGHAGSAMWPHFLASGEAQDGQPDPLDRWSRKVINAAALTAGGRVLMPSDGPPYWPFQSWAQRCEQVYPSPLGLLVHPEYGLWHGYRGAIALPGHVDDWDTPPGDIRPSPCESCADRPCLTACPVGAMQPGAYDVAACRTELTRAGPTAPCFDAACLARAACPVGASHRYAPAHGRFHTEAFAGADWR